MNVLDLFSGIGGFSLGLERAGMRTVAFCEIDPYCRAVLRKHWPGVPIFEDVRELDGANCGWIDVICGGFPCQDISVAGKGVGLAGERSGLWREYARIIGEIRPRYVIVENVAALLGRGLADVLGDLSALGYDAEWSVISAADVGAPHLRERVWIVAYPQCMPSQQRAIGQDEFGRSLQAEQVGVGGCDGTYPNSAGHQGTRLRRSHGRSILAGIALQADGQWKSEPELDRVAHGIPSWAHRVKSLGNAVVPQIPEIIGRAIMQAEGEMK